jgi:hypothetical protein
MVRDIRSLDAALADIASRMVEALDNVTPDSWRSTVWDPCSVCG